MKTTTLIQRLAATSLRPSKTYRRYHLPSSSGPSGQPPSISDQYDMFYRYTSGRWLWDEEKQLQDRFTPFNVPELQRIAATSIKANKCVAMTKLAEGSFNKTFYLRMDNGSTLVARIPHPIAGPKYYTTASEVATMDFVRPKLLFLPVAGCLDIAGLLYLYYRLVQCSRYPSRRSMRGTHTSITPLAPSISSWRKLWGQN